MKKTKKKNFKEVFSKYKTYDDSFGRGSVDEWRDSFNRTYSQEEAKTILKEKDPYFILGLDRGCNIETIKSQYRKLVRENHPDRGGDPIKCKAIIAAYSILEISFEYDKH